MPDTQQTIALAGVGSLGKYVYEELVKSDFYNVIVISRRVSPPNPCSSHKQHH